MEIQVSLSAKAGSEYADAIATIRANYQKFAERAAKAGPSYALYNALAAATRALPKAISAQQVSHIDEMKPAAVEALSNVIAGLAALKLPKVSTKGVDAKITDRAISIFDSIFSMGILGSLKSLAKTDLHTLHGNFVIASSYTRIASAWLKGDHKETGKAYDALTTYAIDAFPPVAHRVLEKWLHDNQPRVLADAGLVNLYVAIRAAFNTNMAPTVGVRKKVIALKKGMNPVLSLHTKPKGFPTVAHIMRTVDGGNAALAMKVGSVKYPKNPTIFQEQARKVWRIACLHKSALAALPKKYSEAEHSEVYTTLPELHNFLDLTDFACHLYEGDVAKAKRDMDKMPTACKRLIPAALSKALHKELNA